MPSSRMLALVSKSVRSYTTQALASPNFTCFRTIPSGSSPAISFTLPDTSGNATIVQMLVFNAFVFAQIFNSVNSRRLDQKLNIFEGMLNNWYFMAITLIEIAVQVVIVFIGGTAFQVTRIAGREWGISLALGFVSIPLGALIRLLPNGPFECLFIMMCLLPKPEGGLLKVRPDVEWNSEIELVCDNLATFANLRGGRLRSSSFVVKSCQARLHEDKCVPLPSLMTMVPTLIASSIGAGWAPQSRGTLSDPARYDPSKSSAALWEGRLQIHPDTKPNDALYRTKWGDGIMFAALIVTGSRSCSPYRPKAVRILRFITEKSVEEAMYACARYKLDIDDKVIQVGRFDNKSTQEEQEEFLRSILEADQEEENEEAGDMNDDELNEIFCMMDLQREWDALDAWRVIGNRGKPPLPLMQLEELPECYQTDEPFEPKEIDDAIQGRGQRRRNVVNYNDGLSDEHRKNDTIRTRLESRATRSVSIPVADPSLHPFPKALWHLQICLCLLCFRLSPKGLICPDCNIDPLALPPSHAIKRL
ncbi:cation transporting ATPase [Suillus lakei]|nr:cation transporting ATPase [Suillus lakei]